ncbi:DEP domain-containing protein 1B-like [Saccostrea cucullata]|uniref:DEP domain-containing protein 1B-like n=1 Tax=Saccostrea cuccullata TaxID=36930 RepID=UPI002ED1CE63
MAQPGNGRENPITGPYRATKLWNEVICAFRQGVPAGRHRRYMKTYEKCFTATEAVDWLHNYLKSNCNFASEVTRGQTLQLLQKLHRARVIEDVRGVKHNQQDISDNGRLLRCKVPSPAKIIRTPLRIRNDIINTTAAPSVGPIKLDLDLQLETRPDIPECHIVAKELSATETENIWKNVTLDKLQQVLHMENLEDILDSSLVVGKNILHNCVYINKSGIVTNIPQKDQLPHWALSAMKCLAHWPQKVDDLPSYPGFERDVFRVVKEYFCGLDEPLMTFEMYEVVLNVFIVADGSYQLLPATPTSPDAMTSFESVENLLLDLTNTRSGSCSGPPEMDHTPLCRKRSAPSLDLSPIHPIPDHEKVTNYETAFGPDNRTVTRVYYRNGVAMDYSNCEETEVFGPIETHFESSEPLQVPKFTECQTYDVNYARIRPVTRRKSDSRKTGEKKSEAYRRRSYGPSSVGLVSSPSCGDCTVQQSSRSYNGYISSRSSSQGEEGGDNVPTRTGFPRSKSSISLHACAHQDLQSQLLAECQLQRQQQKVFESCESLPGRSLSLSDLMHAGTLLKSKLKKSNTATDLCEGDREERIKDALQYVCLLLPPANRRKLHLLLKLMSRMSDNPKIELDVCQTTRALVLETFASCILSCHDDSDREDSLVMQIVSFLSDHYNHILSVPEDLTTVVQERLSASTKTQVMYSSDTVGLTYCHQVSKSEYETQRLSNSQRALRDLLDEIISDRTMSYKDKKKRLKIFQKTYPDIYAERFPPHNSKPAVSLNQKPGNTKPVTSQDPKAALPPKPKLKQPLLVKPLLKLKGLRI